MPLFADIINIVLPVFLVIGLGYFLRRIGLLDAGFFATTNKLVYYVSLPLLLFYKIGTADFATNFNPVLVGGVVAVAVALFVVTYLLAGMGRLPTAARGTLSQGACRGNLAYMGLAIVFNAYGDDGLTRASILMGFLVPVYNLGSITVLTLPHHTAGEKFGFFVWLRQLAFNPLIIAAVTGIVWSLLGLPLPRLVSRSLEIATGMTLPLALFAIGGSFSLARLGGDLRLASVVGLWKLVLMPLATALVLVPLGVGGLDLAVGLLLAGAPAAAANYIMAAELDGDAELAGTIVMLTTLLSAVSYTALLLILHGWGV